MKKILRAAINLPKVLGFWFMLSIAFGLSLLLSDTKRPDIKWSFNED